jgi:hypothetical protein
MTVTRSRFLESCRARRGRFVRSLAVVAIAIGGTLSVAGSQADQVQLRAALTLNFAKFITWPAEAFPSDVAPFRVAVVSDDSLAKALEGVVRGRLVGGRPITVLRAVPADDLAQVQLVFLGNLDDQRMTLILDKLRSKPVLTVADGADFTRRGGMIGIILANETFHFEVNAGALKRASLQANAAMLSLAITTDRKPGR